MYRFIISGVKLLALGVFTIVPAVAEQFVSDHSQDSLKSSSSLLNNQRLFFSVQERESVQPVPTMPKPLAADQQASVSSVEEQKKTPAPAKSVPTPVVDKVVVHYQAFLEGKSTLRLVINGVPCEVITALSPQGLGTPMAVDCHSAVLPGVNLSFIAASRMLGVEEPKGTVRFLSLGDSL